jgi:hypothetical protein
MEVIRSSETSVLARLQGATSHNTALFIVTTVKTSNPTNHSLLYVYAGGRVDKRIDGLTDRQTEVYKTAQHLTHKYFSCLLNGAFPLPHLFLEMASHL